MYVTITVVPHR